MLNYHAYLRKTIFIEQKYLAKNIYLSDLDSTRVEIKTLEATENETDFHVEYKLTSLKKNSVKPGIFLPIYRILH